jgi:hypothetical protein
MGILTKEEWTERYKQRMEELARTPQPSDGPAKPIDLTDSQLRLIHELMFFFPPDVLDEARKKLKESEDRKDAGAKTTYQWGSFLRRNASVVYHELALKLDNRIMMSPTVIHRMPKEQKSDSR